MLDYSFLLQNDDPSGLYIIQKGRVRLTYNPNVVSPCNLLPARHVEGDDSEETEEHVVEIEEGSHFGEWALIGQSIDSLMVVSIGDVVCSVITREKFESIVGHLPKLPFEDRLYVFIDYWMIVIICLTYSFICCLFIYFNSILDPSNINSNKLHFASQGKRFSGSFEGSKHK